MKFNSASASSIYSGRSADSESSAWLRHHVNPEGKTVLDIGCGGGIYTRAFHELGASRVIGIDGSKQYVDEALVSMLGIGTVSFMRASATDVGLADGCSDIIFERALVHHLSADEQLDNAKECFRLLRNDGKLVVQDRTIEDVLSQAPETWIRNTLIEIFPQLLGFEEKRRPKVEEYEETLSRSGFTKIQRHTFVETRRSYSSVQALREEVMKRKGKSILFELSDAELSQYCDALEAKSASHALVEKDPWSIWIAEK